MTALRELAERWKAYDGHITGKRDALSVCADELLHVLDAEGDGGAVAWREKVDEIANNIGESLNAGCDQDAVDRINVYVDELCALSKRIHPARSGVVSDEDVEAACKIYVSNGGGSEVNHYVRVNMRAALEHFAKGERHER